MNIFFAVTAFSLITCFGLLAVSTDKLDKQEDKEIIKADVIIDASLPRIKLVNPGKLSAWI